MKGIKMKNKVASMPNINVSIHEGDLSIVLECPAGGRCGMAQFFFNPPEQDDECAYMYGVQECGNKMARAKALRAAMEAIESALTEVDR